jgi:UDP-xylose/UDP-N-acetylglucosamine transporter B4
MWAYLICNMITQYFCIRSVFILTTECSSLIVTLVITLRKFISLIFSIIYFQNDFTLYHWIGTAAVFLGTFLFSNIHKDIYRYLKKDKIQHVE